MLELFTIQTHRFLFERYRELIAQGKRNSFEVKEIIKIIEAELHFGSQTIH